MDIALTYRIISIVLTGTLLVIFILLYFLKKKENELNILKKKEKELNDKYNENDLMLNDMLTRYKNRSDIFVHTLEVSLSDTYTLIKQISSSYSVSNKNKFLLIKFLCATLYKASLEGEIDLHDLKTHNSNTLTHNINIFREKLNGNSNITDIDFINSILAMILYVPKTKKY